MSVEAPARRGLIDRMAAGYGDPRASTEALLAERPSDGTLLSLLMLAGFIGFVGRTFWAFGTVAAGGEPPSPERLQAELGAEMVGALFFAPLAVYAVAALARLVGRALGGEGDWYACRLACVWAALLSAPALALGAGVAALAIAKGWASRGGDSLDAASIAPLAAALYALYLWAGCLSAAHRVASPWRIFAVAAAALLLGFVLVHANG